MINDKVALLGDWLKPTLNKLGQEEKQISQSSKSVAKKLQKELGEIEMKLSKLLDMQLEGSISLEEYKQKKEELINRKTALKQKISLNWQFYNKEVRFEALNEWALRQQHYLPSP